MRGRRGSSLETAARGAPRALSRRRPAARRGGARKRPASSPGLAERGVLRKAFFPCAVWIDPLLRPNDTLINNSCWQYRLSGADPRAPQRKPLGRAPWVRRLSARSGAEVMW